MTFHYITLHYIISHYIALHYIISHYITDRKHTLPSACACSIECMYVCAVFDGAKRYARSDVSIPEAKRMQTNYGASCLLLPECSAAPLPAWSLCSSDVLELENEPRGLNRMAVLSARCMVLQSYVSVCSVAPLQQRYAVTLNRSSQALGASFRRLHVSEKSCSRKSCWIAWDNLRVDQAESGILSSDVKGNKQMTNNLFSRRTSVEHLICSLEEHLLR